MIISSLKKPLEDLHVKIIQAEQKAQELNKSVAQLSSKIQSLENDNSTMNEASAVLAVAASTARENAKNHFESIVTNALQFVTQDTGYKFVIEDTAKNKASKPSYEFYVQSTINGVDCLQKPQEANGGGFVDIIATVIKHAYLEIFNDPKIMSATLLYDEPAKMVSEDMSVRFAEYIKFLGSRYGRQTIMITHNDNLASVADKTLSVQKHADGISHVQEDISDIDISADIIKENHLKEDTNGNINKHEDNY